MKHSIGGVVAIVVTAAVLWYQAPLEGVRWWTSQSLAASLHLTPEQARSIDMIYRDTLPARTRVAQDAAAVRSRVSRLNHDSDAPDEELMAATEQLARIEATETALGRRLNERISALLSAEQRSIFQRLVDHRRLCN